MHFLNTTFLKFATAACAALMLPAFVAPAAAQVRTRSTVTRSRYNTPYMSNYLPYQATYNANQAALYQQAVSPKTSALPPVTGPAERYSPVEYGKIVQMAVDAARRNTPKTAASAPTTRLVDMATTKTAAGQTVYTPINIQANQVLDRGIILLASGEELRLRGVDMPSSSATNDILRLYAKEGVQNLTNLITGKELTVLLDDPLRDSTGRILATIILPDGTELNRKMLEMGYGSVKDGDFPLGVDYSDLKAAQETAKASHLGIWSRR